MKIKEKLSKIVHEAITNYDFEEAIDNALDEIDIEDMKKNIPQQLLRCVLVTFMKYLAKPQLT